MIIGLATIVGAASCTRRHRPESRLLLGYATNFTTTDNADPQTDSAGTGSNDPRDRPARGTMPTDRQARRSSVLSAVPLQDRQKFAEEKACDLLVLVDLGQLSTYRGSGGNNQKFGNGEGQQLPPDFIQVITKGVSGDIRHTYTLLLMSIAQTRKKVYNLFCCLWWSECQLSSLVSHPALACPRRHRGSLRRPRVPVVP